MIKIFCLIIFITSMFILTSCKDDEIVIPKSGSGIFPYRGADFSLTYEISTYGRLSILTNGFIRCDSIAISFRGFTKDYYFTGYIHADTSITLEIAPLDSSANSKLKLEAKQNGTSVTGELYYCPNDNNICNYTQIGNFISVFTDHIEGFYYSPLFNGEIEVHPFVYP